MNLGLHIFNLLQEKSKVELPGFGIFTLYKKSAQIDQETSVLLPPTQEVYFQNNKLVFDSDLSKYIADKTGENLFEVQNQIKETVLEWQDELARNKTLFIEELGEFTEDENNTILLSKKDFTANPHYFGLEKISLKEIHVSNTPMDEEDTENEYVFSQSVLWTFLFIIPAGGILFLALNYQDQIFGKKSFNLSVKTATHRIEKAPVKIEVPKDSIKIVK